MYLILDLENVIHLKIKCHTVDNSQFSITYAFKKLNV